MSGWLRHSELNKKCSSESQSVSDTRTSSSERRRDSDGNHDKYRQQFGLLLFLLAAGLTLIFGIMDLVNLAHGSL
jgi:hypothetical protein